MTIAEDRAQLMFAYKTFRELSLGVLFLGELPPAEDRAMHMAYKHWRKENGYDAWGDFPKSL